MLVVGALLLGGTLLPLAPKARDGFPFSNYPMFTSPREFVRMTSMVGLKEEGISLDQGKAVAPRDVANDEVMLAAVTIARAVAGGPAAMARLCQEVAERIVARGNPEGWKALVVVEHAFAPMDYIDQGKMPEGSARPLHRCSIDSELSTTKKNPEHSAGGGSK